MTNVNTYPQAENGYYNGVLYARVFFNEIKPIKVENGNNYCAIRASIIDFDDSENRVYEPIDLIVSGEENKQIMRDFRDKWAKQGNEHTWIADVNIGSIYAKAYPNKAGEPAGVLKGRLIKIRTLKINDDVILGESEMEAEETPMPIFVSPSYLNDINLEKQYANGSLLNGKMDNPNYQTVNLDFVEKFDEFKTLDKEGNRPKGYKYRDTNPTVFAVLEMRHLGIHAFSDKKTKKPRAVLKAQISGIRHLSVKAKQQSTEVAKSDDKAA